MLVTLALYLLVSTVLGLAAFVMVVRRNGRLSAVGTRLQLIEAELSALRTRVAALGPAPEPELEEQEPEPEPIPEKPETVTVPSEPAEPVPEPTPAPADRGTWQPQAPEPKPKPERAGLEESLTSRWLVWLGAVALALAGIFLVKYSIDRGWLGPNVRVALGFAFGVLLVGAGEWLRQRPMQKAIAKVRADYVPPALTSAGLFSAFASVYAAYQLYNLIPPVVAFGLLAVLALCAVGFSVLQGPLVAVLGLAAGFATPALVAVGEPSAWTLFPYLLVLATAALVVVRYMAWWWLAWAVLAGSALWSVFWFAFIWNPGDAIPLGLYLALTAALFLLIRRHAGASVELVTWRRGLANLARPDRVAWIAGLVIAVLTYALVRRDAYETESLVALGVVCVLFMAVGYREAAFDVLAIVGAGLAVALLATWHLPKIITPASPLYIIETEHYGAVPGPLVPPELLPFLAVSLIFGLVFAIAGYVALWGARRPVVWAVVSAYTPMFILTNAYWRIADFEIDFTWSAVALALAGLFLAASARVERYRDSRGFNLALGLYAAATVAAISLAGTMALERAWLTVALSLQLPALAWIHDRLKLTPVRVVAAIIAAAVLVRLVLNIYILDYPLGNLLGINWVLYGYGIPALAFFLAARRFRKTADDRLVLLLDAASLLFAVLLVTFEIRTIVTGHLDSLQYGLLERSLHVIAWLAMAYGLLLRNRYDPRPASLWGWRLLAGLAVAEIVCLQLLLYNPLFSGDPVGTLPVLNLLAVAYALPAAFAFLFAWQFRRDGQARLAGIAGASGLVLVFAYLSLEVRHLFHGAILGPGVMSDGELYTYSLVWLVYALGLLALGIRSGSAGLRYASLVLLMLTVAKVFLIDMSALTGLLRVASFLGLGLSLVGIGYVYQRFVLPAPKVTGAGPEALGSDVA